jgi:hypothetical protein
LSYRVIVLVVYIAAFGRRGVEVEVEVEGGVSYRIIFGMFRD